jgi:hypothetical protein
MQKYLLITWINDNPLINGCKWVDTEKELLDYWKSLPEVEGITYTICKTNHINVD